MLSLLPCVPSGLLGPLLLSWGLSLQELSDALQAAHKEEAATAYDKLHMENKRAGRDKYKTLRQIRGGNTKRRIDMYENM